MNKVKEFCKKHKKGIILTGCVVGGVVIAVITKKGPKKRWLDITGKEAISWIPTPGVSPLNLEEAKELLDLNANNNSGFMIFRQGHIKDAYTCVTTNEEGFKWFE